MEFNNYVIAQLYPILKKHGFEVTEEFNNNVRFQSSKIEINIVFNNYENTNYVSIGRRNEILYPLNDNVIRIIFNSDLLIELVTSKIFVQNLSVIFQQKEGNEILNGNINHLVKFFENECKDYTFKLLQHQTLELASKAWERKDYKTFVKTIDEIDVEKIPKSFLLKYKIAMNKL